jgi:hypothetical protein
MSADINNYYDKAERALKRLSIFVVDEYEEMKRGNPVPIVGLMRKILFSTSTTVMKQMLLRGCASHVSDKKFIIAVFDLLRDTVKHSPSITIDQFFTMVIVSNLILLRLYSNLIVIGICKSQTEYGAQISRVCGKHRPQCCLFPE